MELYSAHHAGSPAAASPVTAEAASSDPAQQLRARKDPRFTHQDLRELFSLTRSLGELVEQVSKNSVHGPAENMEQSLSLLMTGASRLSAAAENLRERSNAGNTRGGIFWEHFDVEGLFRVLMISTRSLVGGKPVKVEMVSGEGPLTMWSDSDKVMQIASNLLGNAARYTDRGRITLILGRQQDQLTLMVTDTGKGMAEADVQRITSRMNDRVRRRTSGSRAGDAGLIRTNALVELLGGRLSLASRLNEGTIVEVRLPLGTIRVEPAPVRELTARLRV
jgi:signal transduction histidine kinase